MTHGLCSRIVLDLGFAAAILMAIGCSAHAQQTERAGVDIQNLFTASGFMGDGEYGRKYIDFSATDRTNPHSSLNSIRVTYTFGPKRWGGIYWQNKPDNWGEKPGFDYSGMGFRKVTFWARGAVGGEVVEFKVGGIDNPNKEKYPYRDSLQATTGRVTLTKEWTQYKIDIFKANLSSVIGGFCWVASADYNTGGKITFYLDGVRLE